ncbi:MAG: ABC transporter permease [Planctomycetes bacterium]|nr:ABC transporter permease [Planctomycetota bacterium]
MEALYRWLWLLVPANPLVVRIVQGGSRRTRHLWVRMGYLGLLIVMVLAPMMFGGVLSSQMSLTDLAKTGAGVFEWVSYGQVIGICLLAPLFMSGAIAAEQSGQTFNILLTTPLTNLQIVLGSLLGRLFFVLALLASGLPLFAVLLIFGGVPIRSVFVSFAVTGLSALLMGSVAVTLAVLRAGGRKAVFLFVISIAAYLVLGFAIDQFVLVNMPPAAPGQTTWFGPVMKDGTTWLTPLHPILVLKASLNSASYRTPTPEELSPYWALTRFYLGDPFGAFAALTGLTSMVLILWSAARVRAVGEMDGRGGLRGIVAGWLRLGNGGNRRRKPRDVWANSIAWREANTRGNRAVAILMRWGFFVIGVGAAAVLLLLHHLNRLPAIGQRDSAYTFRLSLQVILLVELVVIVLVAIYMSAGSVSREREDGTLDLLLTTPVTPRQYIWGKLRGLVSFLGLMLAAPVATLALAAAYSGYGQWMQWPRAMMSYSPPDSGGGLMLAVVRPMMLPEAPLLLALVLVPYVAVCVMTGMYWSLRSRGVLTAVSAAVAVLAPVMLVTGFCGWRSAEAITFIGPMLNAFSPTTGLIMIVNPWERISGFSGAPEFGRFNLFMAAVAAVVGYGVVIYALLTSMVGGFDHTVRRLSGTGA